MTENKVSGRSYRVLVDSVNDIWQTYSFWKKAEDVEIDIDDTTYTLEDLKAFQVLKRATHYDVGDIAYESTAPSWVILMCKSAGTTASIIPSEYGNITTAGELITDGTVEFRVCDIRPMDSYSDSEYSIPSMALIQDIEDHLDSSDASFNFGVNDGNYGVWVGSEEFLQF